VSNTVSPFLPATVTGAISSLKVPSFTAACARRTDSVANSSCSSRVKPYFDTHCSPNTPMACLSYGLTSPSHAMWSSISTLPNLVPVREFISTCGALVIDSMPPATTTSTEPALMASCASITAFMPEPQTLLMVVQAADVGTPAPIAAWRAGAWPRPAGSTQPMITSCTWSGASPACSSAALMATAPSVGVGTPVNCPSSEPSAVRLAPTMTIDMEGSAKRGSGRIMRRVLRCGKPVRRGRLC
jgi:hypothetical protein